VHRAVPHPLVGQDNEFVFHVDDFVEPGTGQIVLRRFLLLFRSYPIVSDGRSLGDYKAAGW
jgi:hypothetical protein